MTSDPGAGTVLLDSDVSLRLMVLLSAVLASSAGRCFPSASTGRGHVYLLKMATTISPPLCSAAVGP